MVSTITRALTPQKTIIFRYLQLNIPMMYLQQTLIGHEEADLRGQNLPELPQQPSSRLLQQQLLLKPLLGLQRDYQEKKKKN